MTDIFKFYESQVLLPDTSLDQRDQIQIINRQLKAIRDQLCENAASFDDLLMSQYAYIVTTLNMRNRVWPYDSDTMSFQRRVGELWESFCKAAFYASKKTRIVKFPHFEEVKHDLGHIPEQLWELLGNVNMKTDSLFVAKSRLHAIDLKYGFNSHEKGNMQRLKSVGAVYKLWKPKVKLLVLVKETDNSDYLTHLDEYWEVHQGTKAYKAIKDLTGHDLRKWITGTMNFKKHLDKDLYRNVEKKNLENYLTW